MHSRRGLLAAALGAAGVLAGRPAGARAPKIAKVSKAMAMYQPTPKDIQSCASCAAFVAPSRCKTVYGKVSPKGWCMLFQMVD